MPEEGVPLQPNDKLLTTSEIIRLAKIFVEEGVNKIRLTGGEPTVRKDIVELMQELANIQGVTTLGLTTNGIALARKLPKMLPGLNALNVSLDTLDEHKFEIITRRRGFKQVMNSIEEALALGVRRVKINCVVQRGVNDMEIPAFIRLTETTPIEIRFIEYMPFDGNTWTDKKFMSYLEMIKIIEGSGYPLSRMSAEPNETSKGYKVEGHAGSVGFITSMSENFCSTCNRVRLMADGAFKVCLFGPNEISLRDLMRAGATDHELREWISIAVKRKTPSHAGMYELDKDKKLNRPMILIGG